MTDQYIFFDRDGTIVKDKKYVYKISDLEFLPYAIEGMIKLQSMGYTFIVVSNQAGIAKKIFTEEDSKKFNDEMVFQLKKHGVNILACYICPHHPKVTGYCYCRKPNPGMVKKAGKHFGIHPQKSIFIGDKDCDIELGQKFQALTFLIDNKQYLTQTKPHYTVKNLLEVYNILSSMK